MAAVTPRQASSWHKLPARGNIPSYQWLSADGSIRHRLAAHAVVLAVLAGCGGPSSPPTYPVSGTVLYQGKPLTRGTVFFVPEDGPAAGTAIEADGSFRLRAVAGRHQVGVTSIPEPPPGANPMTYDPPPPLIPAHYSRPHTSDLSAEVRPGGNNRVTLELH